MQNTDSRVNHRLSPYEIEQPIASLLLDYANDLAERKRNGASVEKEDVISHASLNALGEIEQWSRAIGFLIWKASTSDDACEETVYSMGVAAGSLSCFASLVQPLRQLEKLASLETAKD